LTKLVEKRQTAWMVEQAQAAYSERGILVNIAVWNMHLDEDHDFDRILESGLVPMGAGGGFRIVVFSGSGWFRNNGSRGFENWRCRGRLEQDHNLIRFQPVWLCPDIYSDRSPALRALYRRVASCSTCR